MRGNMAGSFFVDKVNDGKNEYLETSSCTEISTDNPLFALRLTFTELLSANTSTGDVDTPLWKRSAVFSIRTRFLRDLFDVFTIYGTSNRARASKILLLPTLGLPISTLMRRQPERATDFTDLKFLITKSFMLPCADLSIICKFTNYFGSAMTPSVIFHVAGRCGIRGFRSCRGRHAARSPPSFSAQGGK